jgi:hypothetical protein
MVMNFHRSHLRPDGTTWPPVTPDPPPPPGYVDPIAELEGTAEPPADRGAAAPPDAADLAESA